MIRIITLVCVMMLCALVSIAQKKDTIHIQGKSILILSDTSFYIDQDTMLILPDSLSILLRQDTARSRSALYHKMKELLGTSGLTNELFHLLFDETGSKDVRGENKIQNNYNTYPEYAGKIIGKIKIKKLDVFGPEISDTASVEANSWIIRKANDFHSYTKTIVIKNHLFFNEGDLLNPTTLEDSERTLRSLPFIKDARILIDPINEDIIDIVVVVKDNWSINPEVEFLGLDQWRLQLADRNFMGLGHDFVNEVFFDNDDNPQWGYRGLYRVRNIQKTFISADFLYAEADNFMDRSIHIYRDFVTPDIKVAGGIEFGLRGRNIIRQLEDTIIDFDTRFEHQDYWLSRAYPIGADDKRKRIVVGGRYKKLDFHNQPEVRADSNYLYFDREQYLFNIGFSKRDYSKNSLIYGYGRTEDIPEGYKVSLTIGKEQNQFYDRWYGELEYSKGGYLGRIGYVRPTISIGSFIRNGRLEQGVVEGQVGYFSNLYYIHQFAFRQFFFINYTHGFRRFGNEFISINDRDGVRGLSNLELLGTKRLVMRAENVSFTPFYVLGFRLAIFAFADFGAVAKDERANLLKGKFYQGYGIGVRLRNENLAIKSISIRFALYPNAPAGATPYDLNMGNDRLIPNNDFIVEPPSVNTFR